MKKLLVLALLLSLAWWGRAEAAAISCAGLPGSVADPAGDALNAGAPDIVCAGVQRVGSTLQLRVAFAAGSFDPATSHVGFSLDVDQNPLTGFPGVDAANNDSAVLGTEFIVVFGSDFEGGVARVRADPTFATVGTGSVDFFDNGMLATIPLALLGGDDGIVNFKATVQTQVTDIGFTGIQDYATDVGLAPGISAVPEPGSFALVLAALLGTVAAGRHPARRARLTVPAR